MLICMSPELGKKRGGEGGAVGEGEMNPFKQMNSNEASQTRRLESVSAVRGREREKPRTSPLEKDSAQTPEREGEKNKRRDPGESKLGGRMIPVMREGEPARGRGEAEFKVVFRIKDCPPQRPTQTSSRFKSLFIRPKSVCACVRVRARALVGLSLGERWRGEHMEFKFKLADSPS